MLDLLKKLKSERIPVVLAINKIDLINFIGIRFFICSSFVKEGVIMTNVLKIPSIL